MTTEQTPISAETLLGIIEESTKTKRILVESTDYYRRPGDTETDSLDYVDPYTFKELLQRHIDWQKEQG